MNVTANRVNFTSHFRLNQSLSSTQFQALVTLLDSNNKLSPFLVKRDGNIDCFLDNKDQKVEAALALINSCKSSKAPYKKDIIEVEEKIPYFKYLTEKLYGQLCDANTISKRKSDPENDRYFAKSLAKDYINFFENIDSQHKQLNKANYSNNQELLKDFYGTLGKGIKNNN